MALPTSNWMKLNEKKFQKMIRDLKVYEVKEPDMAGINLRNIIYLLEASREEIYKLINTIEVQKDQIQMLEKRTEEKQNRI